MSKDLSVQTQDDEKADLAIIKKDVVSKEFVERREEAAKWLFGFRMGYMKDPLLRLPKSLEEVASDELEDNLEDVIEEFKQLIDTNGTIRRCLTMAIEEQVTDAEKHGKTPSIKSVVHLINLLNHLVSMSPYYAETGNTAFPMSAIFDPLLFMKHGYTLFLLTEFNDSLRKILAKWCAFLDSPESCDVLTVDEDVGGWFQPVPYKELELDDFILDKSILPHWGFTSYNSFFHREIKLECRPLAGENDDSIIVSANDGVVYNVQENVKLIDDFWVKGEPYSLINMLNNNKTYMDRFIGGTVIQTFLSGADYHRWRSPVAGTVVDTEIVPQLMFVQLPFTDGIKWPAGGDPSQGLEACQNTRGLVYIEADNKTIGTVVMIPIGITEISSVTFAHDIGKPLKIGDHVGKGDEIGYFSFGGSSMVLVFEPNVLDEAFLPKEEEVVKVRGMIAKVKAEN